MAFRSLAGTVVTIKTGQVTILDEIMGIPSGFDIYGQLCFPAQITESTQRFIRIHEILEVVKTPEKGNLLDGTKSDIQRDIRNLRASLDRRWQLEKGHLNDAH